MDRCRHRTGRAQRRRRAELRRARQAAFRQACRGRRPPGRRRALDLLGPAPPAREPSIFGNPRHQDFIYSSHEGTTHTLRDGLAGAAGTADFTTNYRNQVNIWTSKDGRSWSRVNLSGTGFEANPSTNQGFSDPDLTQDAGGRVYNTGIDLVNDALFSSADGGKTWDRGTPQCHDGDRPGLAGGGQEGRGFNGTKSRRRQLAPPDLPLDRGGQTCSTSGITGEGK